MPEEPCPNEVDYAIQDAKGLLSTGFGRIVSKHLTEHEILVPSFLKAGFEMVERYNSSSTFEPINKAIHYQSFIEIMPVVDMEFVLTPLQARFLNRLRLCKRSSKPLKSTTKLFNSH